ncbi:hypothetical protein BD413DRAFT_225666 [Trametes elegans]|nr:hypothetical protein BD413DRAFT_225666 [Trametes elegans]
MAPAFAALAPLPTIAQAELRFGSEFPVDGRYGVESPPCNVRSFARRGALRSNTRPGKSPAWTSTLRLAKAATGRDRVRDVLVSTRPSGCSEDIAESRPLSPRTLPRACHRGSIFEYSHTTRRLLQRSRMTVAGPPSRGSPPI